MEKIKQQIENDLTNIWSSIKKPDTFMGSKLNDYFEIEIIFFSHLLYAKEKFDSEMGVLRKRIRDHDSEIYGKNKGYSSNMLVKDLPVFIQSAWKSIMLQKDINIPSQKDMVSSLRCKEFKEISYQLIAADIQKLRTNQNYKDPNYTEPVFRSHYNMLLSKAYDYYDTEAKPYNQSIAQQVKEELALMINKDGYSVFSENIRNYALNLLYLTDIELKQVKSKQSSNFKQTIIGKVGMYQSKLEKFIEKEAIIFEGDTNDWKFVKACTEFKKALNSMQNAIFSREIERINAECSETIINSAIDYVAVAIQRITENFWSEFLSGYLKEWDELKSGTLERFKKLGFTQEETSINMGAMREEYYKQTIDSLKKQMIKMDMYIIDYFKNKFNYDHNKKVNWKLVTEDAIEAKFLDCKKKTMLVLNDFRGIPAVIYQPMQGTARRSSFDESDAALSLCEDTTFSLLSERLIEQIENEFDAARRKKVMRSTERN